MYILVYRHIYGRYHIHINEWSTLYVTPSNVVRSNLPEMMNIFATICECLVRNVAHVYTTRVSERRFSFVPARIRTICFGDVYTT